MRQLITRIDDELHARLKARAAAEGRSVNSLVQDLLERELPIEDRRAQQLARMKALGLLAKVPPPSRRPLLSRDEAIALTRGWGTAVSEELDKGREPR